MRIEGLSFRKELVKTLRLIPKAVREYFKPKDNSPIGELLDGYGFGGDKVVTQRTRLKEQIKVLRLSALRKHPEVVVRSLNILNGKRYGRKDLEFIFYSILHYFKKSHDDVDFILRGGYSDSGVVKDFLPFGFVFKWCVKGTDKGLVPVVEVMSLSNQDTESFYTDTESFYIGRESQWGSYYILTPSKKKNEDNHYVYSRGTYFSISKVISEDEPLYYKLW